MKYSAVDINYSFFSCCLVSVGRMEMENGKKIYICFCLSSNFNVGFCYEVKRPLLLFFFFVVMFLWEGWKWKMAKQ